MTPSSGVTVRREMTITVLVILIVRRRLASQRTRSRCHRGHHLDRYRYLYRLPVLIPYHHRSRGIVIIAHRSMKHMEDHTADMNVMEGVG